MTMRRVHFRNENVTIHVPEGTNLRKACLDHDVDPYPALAGVLSCRGKGLCGTCVVQVDDGAALSTPDKREAKRLKGFPDDIENLRLSCRCEVTDDVVVVTDPDLEPSWKTHGFYSGEPVRSWKLPEDV